MIKSQTFLIVATLSWPLAANMPLPPEVEGQLACANKKIGEACGSGFGDNICQMIDGKLGCGAKNRSEQPEVTAKADIISDQEIANAPELETVGCAGAGIPSTVSFTSIILGLLLLIRKRTR